MDQAVQWIDENQSKASLDRLSGRLSFLMFLRRYPVFLLAFGPPLFRSASIDATAGKIDLWSVLQVGLVSLIGFRAIYRLASSESIRIPKKIRSVLKFIFFLGVLFLLSATYSPSRLVSIAYSGLYLLTFACVVEFIADVYIAPPNWLQCLFHLRFIALLLIALDFVVLPFKPGLILSFEEGSGLHFSGGTIGPVTVLCPLIAIISAYVFLHSLEPKVRSIFFFLVGIAGVLSAQARGCELALLFSLSILALEWARTSKRSAYILISGFMAFILFFAAATGSIGGGRIWSTFNRGESAQGIATASGRTVMWHFAIQYCLKHPQGMGYVVGFRMLFKTYHAVGLTLDPSHIGNAHNCYVQVLADAGWLALAVYLIMLIKIIYVGWRFAKTPTQETPASCRVPLHVLRCTIVMLIYLLAGGLTSADGVVPLRTPFYWQNILIAVILGISANMIMAARAHVTESAERY